MLDTYYKLNDELARPCHNSSLSSVVCMFPTNSIVLLMKAHYVLAQTSCSIRLCQDGIEVFYYSQTIASQSQVICCTPGTCITEIKCLLAVERRSWVSIWNSHLAQAESVQNVPSIISDIMEDRSFAGGVKPIRNLHFCHCTKFPSI